MNKKLNNFNPKSTHYVIDGRGELKFISLCPELNQKTAETVLLSHSKRLVSKHGVIKAFEYFKYQY